MVEVSSQSGMKHVAGGGEAVTRRRKMNIGIREARTRLTTPTDDLPGYASDVVIIYARIALLAAPILCLVAGIIAYYVQVRLDAATTWTWFGAVATVLAVKAISAFIFGRSAAKAQRVSLWRSIFVVLQGAESASWAFLVIKLISRGDLWSYGFAVSVLLFHVTASAILAAPIPAAVAASLIAPAASLAIALSWTRAPTELVIFGSVAAIGLAAFVWLAGRINKTAFDGLSFQAEKDALIAELDQARLNSDEARRRAEGANLAKSRFLATMSHELRTPLNAILGFSEVMKAELFGLHAVPAYKEYAVDIHSSGQHLLMLINEILDLSRVEAGRYDLKEEAVSLPNVVDDCVHLLAMRAKNRTIEMTQALDADLPRIWADERAVRQVALNLLSNAIKFTPQGGSVQVKVAWTSAGGQYLSIRDTGPGIPEDEIATVLSSFGRGSLAQKNADEGTGLGLPIVKGLVELHGGEFRLLSKVREGTEVIVIFPPERVMTALPQFGSGSAPKASPPGQQPEDDRPRERLSIRRGARKPEAA